MKSFFITGLVSLQLMLGAFAQANEATTYTVGVTKLTVQDMTNSRPLEGHIWYPSSDNQKEKLIGGNPVWQGFYALSDASVATGNFPLVIISHGSFGNSQNQSWLATSLAKRGYIVATPNHPGTSTFLRDPEARKQLWERPKDLSRTMTMMLSSSRFGKSINKDRILVIGHSLGGFDVMLLMGAQYNKTKHDTFCSSHHKSIDCILFKEWGIATDAASQKKMEGSLIDARVSAVVIFDLGGTQSFTKESLATINKSIFIIGAANNTAGMNIEDESRALALALPKKNTQYIEPTELSHFDFLGICKAEANEILKEEHPRDQIICQDGGEKRINQHKKIIKEVIRFFNERSRKS